MRPANSKNKKLKYRLLIEIMGETKCDEKFTTLQELSKKIGIPYHTISDVYEGRRVSFNRWNNCPYMPKIQITKLNTDIQTLGNIQSKPNKP